jgi:hypothetical protein
LHEFKKALLINPEDTVALRYIDLIESIGEVPPTPVAKIKPYFEKAVVIEKPNLEKYYPGL